jgi:hypothetical protein
MTKVARDLRSAAHIFLSQRELAVMAPANRLQAGLHLLSCRDDERWPPSSESVDLGFRERCRGIQR